LRTSRPIEEALPYSFVGLVCKDACLTRATHILVAFDGPQVFRYKIFPDYKANRRDTGVGKDDADTGASDIYSYLPVVRKYLDAAGIKWIQPKTYEADDVLASCSDQYGKLPNTKVVMDSMDKDGYQSLKPNVVAFTSTKEPPAYITVDSAEKSKGVKVAQMVMYQTLIGDDTDGIPALKTPAAARKLCNQYGSIKEWFAKASSDEKIWLRANQIKLSLNKQLVEMKKDTALPEVDELVVPKLVRKDMPKAWHTYQAIAHPKTKGLFGK
jgi:DNA polymerase I